MKVRPGDNLDQLNAVEAVCWLASLDGDRVDMERYRSNRALAKIDQALRHGAIDGEGWLTERGQEIVASIASEPEVRPFETVTLEFSETLNQWVVLAEPVSERGPGRHRVVYDLRND